MSGYFDPHNPFTQDDREVVSERRVEVMARSRDEAFVIAVDQAREEFRREAQERGVTVEFYGLMVRFSDGMVADIELLDAHESPGLS